MNDYFMRLAKLPSRVYAVTVLDENGDFNIYINTLLSHEAQIKTFEHEIRHIKKHHFYDSNSVLQNEAEADNKDIVDT